MELCGLTPEGRKEYMEDAVRLETFERLGLAHTCCSALLQRHDSLHYLQRCAVTKERQENLRDNAMVPWVNKLSKVVFPTGWEKEDSGLYAQMREILEEACKDPKVSAEA